MMERVSVLDDAEMAAEIEHSRRVEARARELGVPERFLKCIPQMVPFSSRVLQLLIALDDAERARSTWDYQERTRRERAA